MPNTFEGVPIELLEARERGELILCVGPELGRQAGLASGEALALALLDEIDASEREGLRELVDAGRIAESLEQLEHRLGAARYVRVVERTLADRGRAVPGLARAIAGLVDSLRAVYSTGLDRLVERALADAWPSFASPRSDLARRRKLIFKLCGTLEFPETWVLTRAALEREFSERSLRRELLLAVARAHCLLFVGFEPDDELSERIFALLEHGEDEAQLPLHFVILPRCAREQRVLFERRGLQVIVGEAQALLEALAGGHGRAEASLRAALPTCPYPGLQAFDRTLAAVFHGRRAEVSQAVARLGGPKSRYRRWLAIEGSSGVGKSSFVFAGVLPALERGFAEGTPVRWTIAALRPGHRPLRGLFEAFGKALGAEPPGDRERAADWLAARRPADAGLVVVVDQLEEIVTLAEPDERERFALCLAELLERELIHLITTLRSDHVSLLSRASPSLARLHNEVAERYTLAPISRSGLRLAIAEPAAQLGVELDPELVERIATDAEQLHARDDDPEGIVRTDDAALPLVAHVLRGLWDARASAHATIGVAEYRALGGVAGALGRSADSMLAALDHGQRARAKALLLAMVDLDGDRSVRRTLTRAEALVLAGGEVEGERLIGLLSGGAGPRLLVVRSEAAEVLVDLVHEALLREWDTLRGWIAADRVQLARDEALGRRAAAWVGQGMPLRSLPRGPERRELLRGRPKGRAAAEQREYQRAMQRATWLRGGGWVGLIAVLGVATWSAVDALERARALNEIQQGDLEDVKVELEDEKERRVEKEQRATIASQLQRKQCPEALRGTLDALQELPDQAFDDALAQALQCGLVIGELARTPTGASVTSLAFADQGREVWIGRSEGSVERWSLVEHRLERHEGHDKAIESITVAAEGDRLAIGLDDGRTSLRDAEGQEIDVVQGNHAIFLAGGAIATHGNKRAYVHDSSGETIWDSTKLSGKVVAFAGEGRKLLVAVAEQGKSRVLRVSLDSEAIEIPVDGYLRDLALSPGARLYATTADDNYVRLWDVGANEEIATPLSIEKGAQKRKFVAFSPDSNSLLVLAASDRMLIVDTNLADPRELSGCASEPRPRFSPDGRRLLAAGLGQDLRVFDAVTGDELLHAEASCKPTAFGFGASAENIVTACADGQLIHWGLDSSDRWSDPDAHTHVVEALQFASEGRSLISRAAGKSRRWTIGGNSEPHDFTTPTGPCTSSRVFASGQGSTSARVCSGARIELWSATRGQFAVPPTSVVAIEALAVSELGDRLAIGDSKGGIELWQFVAGDWTRTHIDAHDSGVTSLAFSHDGEHLVSGGNDGLVAVWLADTGAREHGFELRDENIETVAIASTGWIAAGDDTRGLLHVWNAERQPTLEVDDACPGRVSALAFSPKGDRVAVGCTDGRVHAWPITRATQIELACERLEHARAPDGSLPRVCEDR
ncbi:SIR2 family protein [Nannocystaceae bacterium ST9]